METDTKKLNYSHTSLARGYVSRKLKDGITMPYSGKFGHGAFRLHCTLAEIECRIDLIINEVVSISDKLSQKNAINLMAEAIDTRVCKPLAEVFPDNPSRYRHSQSKRAYARGYAAGRLKSIKNKGE